MEQEKIIINYTQNQHRCPWVRSLRCTGYNLFEGIQQTAADYLIGSPSFVQSDEVVRYFNSAYLISPLTKNMSKYDKTHLVPFGEYVPFKKWLPFLGKIVAQAGDFKAGKEGETLLW